MLKIAFQWKLAFQFFFPKFLNHGTRRRVTYCRELTSIRNVVAASVVAQC